MKKFLHFLVTEGAQCLGENENFHFTGGIEHPLGPKNAEISSCVLSHVASLRESIVLCGGF